MCNIFGGVVECKLKRVNNLASVMRYFDFDAKRPCKNAINAG